MGKPLTVMITLIILLVVFLLTWQANLGEDLAPDFRLTDGNDGTRQGVWQGAFAGLIFMLGALSLVWLRRYKWLTAGALLILITPLALGGFLFSAGPLGISDWDYYFSSHTALRQTIVEYQQFPQWNPYICGGTAALGDPESPLLTPTFLLELLLGVPTGLRLGLLLTSATAGLGLLLLSRRLGLSVAGGLLAALGFSLSSRLILKGVEGHASSLFALMWLPWIIWAWSGAYSSKPKRQLWTIVCGIFLALTFFQGGLHLLSYVTGAFVFFVLAAKHRQRALYVSLLSGVWALGLSAVKLIPTLLWVKQFPDQAYAVSTVTLTNLHQILLGRYQHAAEVLLNQGGGWHEYGAYLGPIVIGLALLALLNARRNRLVRLLAAAALLAVLFSSIGPLLKPIFDQLPRIPRSNVSRAIVMALIPISLLAGLGLDKLTRSTKHHRAGRLVASLIVGLAAIDLMSLSFALSEQAFVLPSKLAPPASAPPITYTSNQFLVSHNGAKHTRAYLNILSGYGTTSYCSVVGPTPAVPTIQESPEAPFAYLANQGTPAKIITWSPNKLTLLAPTTEPDTLIVNINYATGWSANGLKVSAAAGRLAVSVNSDQPVTVQYQTPGLRPGIIISLFTVLAAARLILKPRGA